MRRLVVVGAAFLLIGFVLGWLCHRLPPRTAPPWSTVVQLAESEAALRACQAELATCRARLSRPLPATGLTDCYTETQEKAPCQSTDRPGQDGFHRAGCPTEGRFVDNGDDTVRDNCTGLMWQRRAPGISGNGSIAEYPEDARWHVRAVRGGLQ